MLLGIENIGVQIENRAPRGRGGGSGGAGAGGGRGWGSGAAQEARGCRNCRMGRPAPAPQADRALACRLLSPPIRQSVCHPARTWPRCPSPPSSPPAHSGPRAADAPLQRRQQGGGALPGGPAGPGAGHRRRRGAPGALRAAPARRGHARPGARAPGGPAARGVLEAGGRGGRPPGAAHRRGAFPRACRPARHACGVACAGAHVAQAAARRLGSEQQLTPFRLLVPPTLCWYPRPSPGDPHGCSSRAAWPVPRPWMRMHPLVEWLKASAAIAPPPPPHRCSRAFL
jgi:hypothetical protein